MNGRMQYQYQFLYDNAGPVIRCEAAAALGLETDELRSGISGHPQVQYWIGCALQFLKRPVIHNAADCCLENWMHKLLSYRVREADDDRLKEVNHFILEYVIDNLDNNVFLNTINSTIAASWLICMGYGEQFLTEMIVERLEEVYGFTKDKDYDIYVNPDGFPSIPKARAMHPLVNPVLYENEIWKLPTVHDIFAFTCLPAALRDDNAVKNKIDIILDYILDDRYQRLYRGYGLMLVHPDRYYSMGWSVHLDNYFEYGAGSYQSVVWSMELLSHFKAARESRWFTETLKHLESYETNGLYEFPQKYLSEGRDKYYVGGGHMGLGENRKLGMSRKIESTAWMLRILRNL